MILPVTGSTVHVPSPATTRVLPSVLPTICTVVGSMSLLASVSLPKTLTVTGVPAVVGAAVSLVATGGSCG